MVPRGCRQCFVLLWISLVFSCSARALDVSIDGMEQEQEIDERTLLDIFGEHAKEYLTQRMIPKTDAECEWSWKHARCEPFCMCSLQLALGDYHLGRACRKRSETAEPPSQCSEPPDTPYVHMLQHALQKAQVVTDTAQVAAAVIAQRGYIQFHQLQTEICQDIPTECPDALVDNRYLHDSSYRRSWKQKLFCTHIPTPCDDNDDDDDDDAAKAEYLHVRSTMMGSA